MKKEEEITSIQNVHIFLWRIYNIIRNLNILKSFLNIKHGKNNLNFEKEILEYEIKSLLSLNINRNLIQ
jgi:hypothetical protein